jgi:hypothetical protein
MQPCGLGWNLQRLGLGAGGCKLGHGFELHVAVLRLPFIVLLHEDGADEANIAGFLGKMRTTSARRLTSLLRRSSGLVTGYEEAGAEVRRRSGDCRVWWDHPGQRHREH